MESEIAEGLSKIATQLKYLGNGDAGSTIGAVEHHADVISTAADTIAAAIRDLADAIRETK